MPVTCFILIINTILFLFEISEILHPINILAKYNENIWAGEYWRIITSIFIHKSFFHFFINSVAIYCFGMILESFIGRWKFLAQYLLSGIFGNLFSLLFNDKPSIGASGAIWGLIGGLAVFVWQNRMHLPGKHIAMILLALVPFIAYNQIFGFNLEGIDEMAHLGGFAGGCLVAWIINVNIAVKSGLFSRQMRLVLGSAVFILLSYFALKPNQESWKWHLFLGDKKIHEGKVHSAIQEYLLAQKIEPGKLDIYIRLAAVYTELKEYDKAMDAWNKVLCIDPGNPTAREQLKKIKQVEETRK